MHTTVREVELAVICEPHGARSYVRVHLVALAVQATQDVESLLGNACHDGFCIRRIDSVEEMLQRDVVALLGHKPRLTRVGTPHADVLDNCGVFDRATEARHGLAERKEMLMRNREDANGNTKMADGFDKARAHSSGDKGAELVVVADDGVNVENEGRIDVLNVILAEGRRAI